MPTYCEACGIHLSGPEFVDSDKSVVWEGFCQECSTKTKLENNSEKSLDIKPEQSYL